jgi:hypothetical protein
LEDAAGASLGRGSVLLHPPAQRAPAIAIGRTAASRRYRVYGCMGKKALEALEALKALSA